jgi:hypothetical protein
MKGGESVRAFTAIGRAKEGEPYLFDMGNDFVPARRNLAFIEGVAGGKLRLD